MKKLICLSAMILFTVSIFGQQVSKRDIEIQKTSPMLHINGLGGHINFYNGNVTLSHGLNELNVNGGRLDVNANLRVGLTSSLIINEIGQKNGKFYMIDSDGDTLSAYIKVADRVDAYTILPRIYSGVGAPSIAAGKAGDIYINTSNGTIYISSAAGSGNWRQVSN